MCLYIASNNKTTYNSKGFDILTSGDGGKNQEEEFPAGNKYRGLITLAKQEASFWSFLKTCFKQEREEMEKNNASFLM